MRIRKSALSVAVNLVEEHALKNPGEDEGFASGEAACRSMDAGYAL